MLSFLSLSCLPSDSAGGDALSSLARSQNFGPLYAALVIRLHLWAGTSYLFPLGLAALTAQMKSTSVLSGTTFAQVWTSRQLAALH